MEVKSNYDIQADKCKLKFIKMDLLTSKIF